MKQKLLLTAFLFILITAANATESEPNNDRASADTLVLNGSNNGIINPAGDQDWWKVTTTADGRLDITLTPLSGKYMYIYIYDNNGTTLLKSNDGNSQFTVSADGLAAGTYYVKIITYFGADTSSYTISNSLTQPAQANDAEPNDTKALAKVLSLNGSKTGHVNYFYNGYRDSADWYKITTNADGRLRLRLTSGNGQYVWAYLYDNDGVTQLKADDTNGSVDINADGLAAGTYYVRINSYYSYLSNTYNGADFEPYTIADSLFVPGVANDAEPNDSVAIANTLTLNGSTTGHSNYYYNHKREANDWYKITTTADGRLRLRLTSGNGQYVWAYLYDNDGVTQLKADDTNGSVDINADGLAAGTYYVRINSYYSYLSNTYNGTDFETYTLADSLFTPAQANDSEPNDSVPIAKTLAVNSSKTGHTNYYYNHKRDAADWYKITLPQDGMLRLRLTSGNGQYIWAYLFDHDGVTQLKADATNGTIDIKTDGLAAGTYYVRINSYYSYGSTTYNGTDFEPYTLADSLFTYSYANDAEPNDAPYQAKTLPANLASTGHVGFYYNNSRNSVDWWKVNYTGSGDIKFNVNENPWLVDGSQHYYWFQVYKDTGAAPIYSQNFSGPSPDINLSSLTQGYYYVKIYPYYGTDFISYAITSSFTQVNIAKIKATSYDTAASCSSINTITFSCSKSSPPYTVKLYRYDVLYATKIAKVKNISFDTLPPGSYYAKAWGDGATGSASGKSKTVNIVPTPTGLSTTNILARQATLNWSAVPCAHHYSIQYRVHGTLPWSIKTTTGNVDSTVLKSLTRSTTYEWEVAAVDSVNGITAVSPYTDSLLFTTAASFISTFASNEQNKSDVNDKTQGLLVYPNPVSAQLRIQWNGTELKNDAKLALTLKDVTGKTVWEASNIYSVSLKGGMNINVSKLPNGIYLLRIVDGTNNTFTKKIIISR